MSRYSTSMSWWAGHVGSRGESSSIVERERGLGYHSGCQMLPICRFNNRGLFITDLTSKYIKIFYAHLINRRLSLLLDALSLLFGSLLVYASMTQHPIDWYLLVICTLWVLR